MDTIPYGMHLVGIGGKLESIGPEPTSRKQ